MEGRALFTTGNNEEWKEKAGNAILNGKDVDRKDLKGGYGYGQGEDP